MYKIILFIATSAISAASHSKNSSVESVHAFRGTVTFSVNRLLLLNGNQSDCIGGEGHATEEKRWLYQSLKHEILFVCVCTHLC